MWPLKKKQINYEKAYEERQLERAAAASVIIKIEFYKKGKLNSWTEYAIPDFLKSGIWDYKTVKDCVELFGAKFKSLTIVTTDYTEIFTRIEK